MSVSVTLRCGDKRNTAVNAAAIIKSAAVFSVPAADVRRLSAHCLID